MEAGAGRHRSRPPEANTVVPYDPGWVDLFTTLHEHLSAVFASSAAIIEHVGSTAVPGLSAKPIVDVDVVVPTADDVPDAVSRLESVGYTHRGDLGIPGREAFEVPLELPYHHLYVVVTGTKSHLDHVLLRDHLRRHPDAATRYGDRKLEVAHLITTESREEYVEAKRTVMEELLEAARDEQASEEPNEPD